MVAWLASPLLAAPEVCCAIVAIGRFAVVAPAVVDAAALAAGVAAAEAESAVDPVCPDVWAVSPPASGRGLACPRPEPLPLLAEVASAAG